MISSKNLAAKYSGGISRELTGFYCATFTAMHRDEMNYGRTAFGFCASWQNSKSSENTRKIMFPGDS